MEETAIPDNHSRLAKTNGQLYGLSGWADDQHHCSEQASCLSAFVRTPLGNGLWLPDTDQQHAFGSFFHCRCSSQHSASHLKYDQIVTYADISGLVHATQVQGALLTECSV